MACGLALKRPHEYDNYLQLGETAPEAKRARTSPLSCSPFRPQMGTLAASLPSSSSAQTSLEDRGIFGSAAARCNVNRAQVDAFIKAEIRSLRRRKLIPKRCLVDGNEYAEYEKSVHDADHNSTSATRPANKYRVPGSPQSASDSEGESGPSSARRRVLATLPNEVKSPAFDLNTKPMYSLNQVILMCERLLKEQELRVRFEYQQILEKKLQEQQDQLSQFAAEVNRPSEDYSCSYLS
ncbi:unnamed protein product, partial [Mesorhabditis spiculigera]